jgi:integrase
VIAALGDMPLSHLSLDALRAQPLGRRRVLQAALRWAVAELGAAVPPACLKLPTGPPPRRTPTDLMPDDVFATIQAAADEVSGHMGAIVHLVGVYGHRPESLAKLRPADLEGARLSLTVKSGDRIRHPILPETVERLRRAPPPFLDPGTGEPFASGWDIARVYRSCLGRSRWKAEPGIYALKRRAISRMLGLNLDAATVASITGHRRPDVLLRHYARTNETRQEAAVAALAQSGDTGTGRVRRRRGAPVGAGGHHRNPLKNTVKVG